jgi:hypothetical protein
MLGIQQQEEEERRLGVAAAAFHHAFSPCQTEHSLAACQ